MNEHTTGPDEPGHGDFNVHRTTSAMARGDPNATEIFYKAWFDRSYSMVRFLSKRDESFCLDVVQDAMIKIVRSVRPFDDADALKKWVARIMYTTTVDSLRREVRRKHHERAAAEFRRNAAAGPDALERLEIEERIEWLESRIRELPDEEKKLLFHRYRLGKTLGAAGKALGITGDAAYGRIRRLLERLRSSSTGKIV